MSEKYSYEITKHYPLSATVLFEALTSADVLQKFWGLDNAGTRPIIPRRTEPSLTMIGLNTRRCLIRR